MTAYYNEIDPFAAAWLRNLIAAGHIAPGDVDERSIEDVTPCDLRGYTQCHFFAGIGVWSHALRTAGWPDDQEIWTGSCPCQPFSAAGKGVGFADERHLWPAFHYLIEQRRPRVVMGEQVASKDGLAWLDLVHADLEGTGYAFGATDLCAAGVGAPHIRQRLYWLADADGARPQRSEQRGADAQRASAERGGEAGGLAHDVGLGRGREARELSGVRPPERLQAGGMAHDDVGLERFAGLRLRGADLHDADGRSPVGGAWAGADWLPCRDGKWRPVESGTFPLAHGAPARVGRLRAYGNAIVAPQAVEVIRAYRELTR